MRVGTDCRLVSVTSSYQGNVSIILSCVLHNHRSGQAFIQNYDYYGKFVHRVTVQGDRKYQVYALGNATLHYNQVVAADKVNS